MPKNRMFKDIRNGRFRCVIDYSSGHSYPDTFTHLAVDMEQYLTNLTLAIQGRRRWSPYRVAVSMPTESS